MKYIPKTKPFKHQAQATIAAVKARNFAIFFEPRLGKSKAALDYVGVLAQKGEVERVAIIAPRIALSVWEQEIEKHFPFRATMETFEEKWINSAWSDPRRNMTVRIGFFLAGREETFRATRKGKKLLRPKQEELEKWRPDAIIFDESHQYKRPGSRGAQDAWRLIRRLRDQNASASEGRVPTPYVLLLSGTPNPKGWRDLFAQFRIMDETILGTSAGSFDEDYVIYGRGKLQYKILAYRQEKRLVRKIRAHSVSVSAKEAGLEGKAFWSPIYVTLPEKAMKAYLALARDFITEVDGEVITAKNAGVLRLRLLQITGGFTPEGNQTHDAKLGPLRSLVELLAGEQGEAMVVGARFLSEVHASADCIEKLGISYRVIEGSTRRSRDQALLEFDRGKCQVLVFQVQAGTAAIDLSRAAELVLYSFPDGWVDFWQFIQRVRGPNQKRPVRYTPILAQGTLDRSVIYGLQQKEDWHATLMKNPDRFLRGLV